MTLIQGFELAENFQWQQNGFEEPAWTSPVTLDPARVDQLKIDPIADVEPPNCGLNASLQHTIGLPPQYASPGVIQAAAFSQRLNLNSAEYTKDLAYFWQTVAYLLPDGEADIWLNDIVKMFYACRYVTYTDSDGLVGESDFRDYYPTLPYSRI